MSSTSVSWVLAQALVTARGQQERRRAVWFSLLVNAGLGCTAAAVVGLVATRFAPPRVAVLLGVATLLIFVASSSAGYLQGDGRFRALAGLRIGDALLKITAGFALVALGAGAPGALAAFGAGALLMIGAGAWTGRDDLRPAPGVLGSRLLWAPALGVVAVQGLVAVLTAVDLVLVTVLAVDPADAATYQAAMILARVPLFLAGAVGASVYLVVARAPESSAPVMRRAVRLYCVLVVPFATALATAPAGLVSLLFPADYSGTRDLLPATAAAGVLIGAVALLATYHQGRRSYVRSVVAQVVGLTLHTGAIVLGAAWAGVPGIAVGAATGAAAVVVALVIATPRAWRPAMRPPVSLLVACAAFAAVLVLVRQHPLLWFAVAAPVGLLCAVSAFGPAGGRPGPDPTTRSDLQHGADPGATRLRILHLAFQDWRKPGSGGGAVRTREVCERLAGRHEVVVLVSNYRGARERVENGVRYVPVGRAWGYWGGILTYFAALPLALRRFDSDLVVEDFGAPIGSVVPHLWTRKPVVGVVQWLNAEEKAEQYHLPFHWVQRWGLRRHRTLVAMSEDLGDKIRSGNPAAQVVVVPNGVPAQAFRVEAARGDDVLFLGRIETSQKGLDLLVEAFAAAADRLPGDLLIAGEGRDAGRVRSLVSRAGLTDRVRFLGRVDGEEKLRLLASARVVAMPSRFETFGIVAAEALACSTPVVAFEIPSLREVVVPGTGVLVPPFDTAAFAEALVQVVRTPRMASQLGHHGREHARRYDWDDVARRQELVYLAAVGASGGSPTDRDADEAGARER